MSKPNTQLIKVEAVLTGIRPLRDGSMSIGFSTQEVSKDFIVDAMQLYQQFGWLLFAPNKVQLDKLPDDPAHPPLGVVSPSQKLKNTLYAYYMKLNAPYGKTGFDKFYREKMEALRAVILSEMEKLDDK